MAHPATVTISVIGAPRPRAGLERALAERPGADVRICALFRRVERNMAILRREDRARIAAVAIGDACDVRLSYPRPVTWGRSGMASRPVVPPAWSLAAYGGAFLDAFDMDAARAARRRAWDAATSRPPDIAAAFDVRIRDGLATYARDGCAPEDLAARFFLHVEPVYPADLPGDRRRSGFDNRDFAPLHAKWLHPPPPVWPLKTRFGASCLVSAPLPDYPIRRVRTGQIVADGGGGWRKLWEGEIEFADEGRR